MGIGTIFPFSDLENLAHHLNVALTNGSGIMLSDEPRLLVADNAFKQGGQYFLNYVINESLPHSGEGSIYDEKVFNVTLKEPFVWKNNFFEVCMAKDLLDMKKIKRTSLGSGYSPDESKLILGYNIQDKKKRHLCHEINSFGNGFVLGSVRRGDFPGLIEFSQERRFYYKDC